MLCRVCAAAAAARQQNQLHYILHTACVCLHFVRHSGTIRHSICVCFLFLSSSSTSPSYCCLQSPFLSALRIVDDSHTMSSSIMLFSSMSMSLGVWQKVAFGRAERKARASRGRRFAICAQTTCLVRCGFWWSTEKCGRAQVCLANSPLYTPSHIQNSIHRRFGEASAS